MEEMLIIRCKNCAWYDESRIPLSAPGCGCHWCAALDAFMEPDEFCSRSELREVSRAEAEDLVYDI